MKRIDTSKQLKAPKYKTLVLKLDRVFAKWIKERDSTSREISFTCISCGRIKPTSQFNCGHYHSRRYMSLRWDEKNNNGQCIYCNLHLKGNIQGYAMGLIAKYGKGIIQELEIKKMQIRKYSTFELQILIKYYEDLIKTN